MSDAVSPVEEAVRAALRGTGEEDARRAPPGSQNGHKPAESALPLFHLLTDVEAERMPPTEGILGDVLFEDSLAYLFGPSGMWKAFVALDWSLSIATGAYWLGRKVKAWAV